MSDVVIRAKGLGKRYLIGHQSAERERYTALRDVLAHSLKGLGRSARDMMRGRQIIAGDEVEEFWALKDVSFEIKRGDVVGVIGRNGAGKSTLLKVLSRITEPSEGRLEVRGRVASLLEVGTGFHPELTGRENIFLNGAILGMTRGEIKRKFDEIVAFAEVERFLDTPVKRYSSGMYVRLAFAVAAHLEPEILVVDEVLAVGDAEFQKKCLGKMQDVAGHGRTVLFVSHNMGAIRNLCKRVINLSAGKVEFVGETAAAIDAYMNRQTGANQITNRRRGNKTIAITSARVMVDDDIQLSINVDSGVTRRCALEINVCDGSGTPIGLAEVGCWSPDRQLALLPGQNLINATIPGDVLARGTYKLQLSLTDPGNEYLDQLEEHIFVDFGGCIRPCESGTLAQSQGHGSIRFPLRVIDQSTKVT